MAQSKVTVKARLSFVHLFKPHAIVEGQTPKYSVALLIPKSDKVSVDKIKGAVEAAKANYLEKHPGAQIPARPRSVVYDGDGVRESGEEFGPECKGCYVVNASSLSKPVVVDIDKNPILDEQEVYSGCYGKAVINFYYYDTAGNKGISAGLNGIMKTADGEPLSASGVSDSDWDDEDEDFI